MAQRKRPAFVALREYLSQYLQENGFVQKNVRMGDLFRHELVLFEMLRDNAKLPQNATPERMRQIVCDFCRGKRFFESGCRNGDFLRFLRDHGASVVGTTGPHYIEKARRMLGDDVLEGNIEESVNFKRLREFKPQFVVSVNLFDASRWRKRPLPVKRMLAALDRLVMKSTRVYVQPSQSGKEVFGLEDLRSVARVRDLSQVGVHGEKTPNDPKRGRKDTQNIYRFRWHHRARK